MGEDLTGGVWRRIRRADGYRYVLLNGEITFADGKETGAAPGHLLRHGCGGAAPISLPHKGVGPNPADTNAAVAEDGRRE